MSDEPARNYPPEGWFSAMDRALQQSAVAYAEEDEDKRPLPPVSWFDKLAAGDKSEEGRKYKALRRFQEADVDLQALGDDLFKGAPTEVSRLRRYNQIRRGRGLEDAKVAPQKVGAAEQLGKEFGTVRGVAEKVPFAGPMQAFVGEGGYWSVWSAAERLAEDKATADDLETIARFQEMAVEDARERTYGGDIAWIVSQVPTFGAEVALSGLGGRAGRTATKTAARTLKTVVREAMKKGVRTLGRTARRLPYFGAHIYAHAMRDKLPEFYLPENGSLHIIPVKPDTSWREALVEGALDTYIELVSEQTGRVVGVVAGPLRKIPGVERLAARTMPVREFFRRFGYHSPIGESFEERIGEGLRYVTNKLAGTDIPVEAPTLDQVGKELVAFSIPGVIGTAAHEAFRRRRPPQPPTQETPSGERPTPRPPGERPPGVRGPEAPQEGGAQGGQEIPEEELRQVLETLTAEKQPAQAVPAEPPAAAPAPAVAPAEPARPSADDELRLAERDLRAHEKTMGYDKRQTRAVKSSMKDDATYQELQDRVKTARRRVGAQRAAETRRQKKTQPQTREDYVATVPVDKLPPVIGQAIQTEAAAQLDRGNVRSAKTRDALLKIVRDRGEDTGSAVQQQKRRLLDYLLDRKDVRTIREREVGVPRPEPDVFVEAYLNGATEDQLDQIALELGFREQLGDEGQLPAEATDFAFGANVEAPIDLLGEQVRPPEAPRGAAGAQQTLSDAMDAEIAANRAQVRENIQDVREGQGNLLTGEMPEVARPGYGKPTKAQQARKDVIDTIDEIGDALGGSLYANPLADPKLLKLAAKLVRQSVRAGVLSFPDFIREITRRVGARVSTALAPVVRKAWDNARRSNKRMGPSEDPGPIIAQVAQESPGEPTLAAPEAGAVRDMLGAADELRSMAGEPERQKDADVWVRGAQRVQKDFDAEKKSLLAGHVPQSAEDVVAQQGVLYAYEKVFGSGDIGETADAVRAAYMYRKTGTESARALRQRRWMTRKAALLESILAPPQELTRRLRSAEKEGDTAAFDAAIREWAEYVAGPIRAEAMAAGFDLNNIDAILANRKSAARLLRWISIRKADIWDKLYEWYSNSIFSGPLTHIVNWTGGIAYGGSMLTVVRLGEAMVDGALRTAGLRSGGARLGEFYAMGRVMARAMAEGGRNFLLTFRDEYPVFLEEATGRPELRSVDQKGVSIGGIKGRAIRAPWRSMSAADDAVMTMIANMEAAAMAYRQAKEEEDAGKVAGNQVEARAMELFNDRSSDAWTRGYADSLQWSFKDRSQILMHLLGAREKFRPLRFLLPTVTTPWNLLKLGVRHTPLGTLALIRNLKNRQTDDATRRFAEQVLAWTGLMAFVALLDPEDPWITGARGTTSSGEVSSPNRYSINLQKLAAQLRGSGPVEGKWYNYGRIEPFATTAGIMVDAVYAIHNGDSLDIAMAPAKSLFEQLDQKTFLQQLSDLVSAVEDAARGRKSVEDSVIQFSTGFLTGFVPNAVRAPIRAATAALPERRVAAPRGERTVPLLEKMLKQTELYAFFDPEQPKIDLVGRERMRDGSPADNPQSDFLWRLLVPMQVSKYNETVVDRVIYNWNRLHPTSMWEPEGAEPKVVLGKQEVWLNDDQYAELQRRRGRFALQLFQQYASMPRTQGGPPFDPVNPRQEDIDVLRRVFSTATQYAKGTMIRDRLIAIPEGAR